MSRHDKKGQTGLLDTFFSRPKKSSTKGYSSSSNNNNNVVSRPISSGDSSEAAPDQINRLADKEVNEKFLSLLDDMNIPKDKRGPLLQKGIEERRKMLLMHVKGGCTGHRWCWCGGQPQYKDDEAVGMMSE